MGTLRVFTKVCQQTLVSFGLGLTLFVALSPAQSPHFDNGPVWRVTYLRIKPGKVDAFYTDLRQNLRPFVVIFLRRYLVRPIHLQQLIQLLLF